MTKNTVTVSIDVELCAEIREIQAIEIRKRNGSVSFSQTLEEVLKRGLKK